MFRNLVLALGLLIVAPDVGAAECAVDLEGNDAMQFNLDSIQVSKSCKQFTINLKHVGKLARNVMGHNVVIVKAGDMNAVNADGMQAGLENNYVKPDDKRVIAHTKIIGGGESASLTIDPAKLTDSEGYAFFCSFPGHASQMKGKIEVVP